MTECKSQHSFCLRFSQERTRIWAHLARHITQQNKTPDTLRLLTNEQFQSERSTPMQIEQLHTTPRPQGRPSRKLQGILMLVAALLIAALLVGSTLWMLIMRHTGIGARNITAAPAQTSQRTAVLSSPPDLYNFTSQGFYALDASTGKQLWYNSTIRMGHQAIVRNKTVYVDDGSTLYAFDTQHGTLHWQYTYGGHPTDAYNTDSKLLVGKSGIYLVEGTGVFASAGPQYFQGEKNAPIIPRPSTLFSFDPVTGEVLWQHTLEYRLNDPVIDGDVIYGIGSTTTYGVLYALKGSNGSVLWQQPLAQTSILYYGFTVSSGTLYFASTNNAGQSELFLYAFALTDGHKRWQSQPMYNASTYNITLAGDTLYYRVGNHDLYAFSTKSGGLLWQHTMPTVINNVTPSAASGLIYLVTQKDLNDPPYSLQAWNASSGQLVWSHPLSLRGSAFTTILVGQNHLYVQSGENVTIRNKMTVFNPKRGHRSQATLCRPIQRPAFS